MHRKLQKNMVNMTHVVLNDSYRWETWIYHFQPDSKAKNKVWVSSEGDRPVIAGRCKTSNRKLYAIFFDSKGPVLQILVPKGSSVTGKFYRESVLTQLVDFCQKRRPRTGVRGIKLLHDNAPAHISATVQEYLKESGLDVLDHPPYSPDPPPCAFWLFPRLKEMLAGHGFESRCGIGSAIYQCLQHIPKEDYRAAFRKWVDLISWHRSREEWLRKFCVKYCATLKSR